MRQACKITAAARALAGEMVRPGVSTKEIDKAVHDLSWRKVLSLLSWATADFPPVPASV
jgi:methionine aminopeptidase